ncbi:hypothetical protein BDW62DRAFT_195817 [Aspergillus aurantiobrunneus]
MLKFFSSSQLAQTPTFRKCAASQKTLWIDPSRFYSFRDIHTRNAYLETYADSLLPSAGLNAWPKALPDALPPPDTSAILRLHSKSTIWRYPRNSRAIWQGVPEQYAICTSYEILTLPEGSALSREELRRVLLGFDLPTCPHTRLGNAVIANSYYEARHCVAGSTKEERAWVGQMQTDGADACCGVPGCKTVFRWESRSGLRRDGWKTLLLHVKRHLGGLLSPLNPRWMAQLVSVPDAARLGGYWEECYEWRDVNMAIEEMRYERESASPSGMLRSAEGVEFEQLRRENDYLRHPHRRRRLPQPDLGRARTARLLVEFRRRRENDACTQQASSLNKSIWRGSTESAQADDGLYMPLHALEAILEQIKDHGKFNILYDDIRLAPFQRNVGNFFWGAGDCLSNSGLLRAINVPIVYPPRRFMAEQLDYLPREVRRRLLEYGDREDWEFPS